ncbi:NmrA/HSCARG family protein [Staphylococcus lugdunensis]|uniref:NmrA/HSCARG family protein n=1 Tax=Staphylococcus lugdunensis TaxID=28035 RepID=UPI00045994F2|nr:NmrA/HSCARG family protein [Staphylococcus lugdunensis]KAK55385.1 NmrA family protein [Staphylococcus lugdunensis VCU150]MCI2845650.1 NmrA/HSCARG family protein [Staphylococcus lugdunensis]MDU4769188.1 NmrA/HSCARG family protein [Staphylococcus lugdunensis]
MKKSILVIGATGKQGNAVVKQLLHEGWQVRVYTRNKQNDKLTTIKHKNLEIFEGDLGNLDSLKQAMEDQFGVYSVQPIILDNVTEEIRQGKMIINTAYQQGIEHIIYSTAGGVNRNRTGPHFEALAQIENELQNSPLNYTIIKPAFFMDNFLRIITVEDGVIYIPEFINKAVKFAMISSIDIAKIAAHIFKNTKQFNHRAIEIASDERTLEEVVKTFATVTGKPAQIKGSYSSGTAEREWLEDKGYEIDFNQMENINPQQLSLQQWIDKAGF